MEFRKLLAGALLLFGFVDSINSQYGSSFGSSGSGHVQQTRSESMYSQSGTGYLGSQYGGSQYGGSQYGSQYGSPAVSKTSESKTSSISKASKASSGSGQASPFARVIEKACGMPQSPMNGKVRCTRTSSEQKCVGQCKSGYEFPDKAPSKEIICYSDGTWTPTATFPDCDPICDPPCENGGVCVGSDQCLCASDYWGQKCEIPRDICDIQENRMLAAKCNGTQELLSCVISCPVGMQFEFPPASVYQCTTDGRWDPPNIPSCTSDNMVVHNVHVGEPEGERIHSMTTTGVDRKGQCITWGGKHFQTYDGKLFSFEGACTYLLTKDCDYNTFSISIDMTEECADNNCHAVIQINMDSEQFVLRRYNDEPSVFYGSRTLPVPVAMGNIVVEKVSHYISITSKLGFSLLWDGKSLLQIEVETSLQNKTCGLCGRYDGSSHNDLETISGKLTSNVLEFADSWKINHLESSCPETNYVKDTCAMLPADVLSDAQRLCGKIKNPEYASCLFLVDPEPYINTCISEYCSCYSTQEDCGCTSISVYFKECQRLGGKLNYGWRRQDFCNVKCAGDMEYEDCGSICPPTCANPGQECTSESCIDACFCPKGMLLGKDQKCYKPEDCPCMYQDREHPSGSTVQQDCNTCMCVNGHWQCSKEVCPARCSSIGDPHYITFDGKHYDFMGKCSYFLVSHTNFTIEQENAACDGTISEEMGYSGFEDSLKASCTKTITIRTQGSELHMRQNYLMVLNGRELTNLPKSSPGMYIYMISASFIKVELINGLSVMWDGKARLYIDISPELKNQVQGLCGTFSLTQKDDFRTPEGDVEANVNAFGNKWKTDDTCEDVMLSDTNAHPCNEQPQLQEEARTLCAKIRSSLFSDCHHVVDSEPFFYNCMYDMCSCKNNPTKACFCPTIADYATACAQKGVVIEWRQEVEECELTCNRGQVYNQCGSSCQRSCKNIAFNPQCKEQCVEGCNCPAGLTLNSKGECIPIEECSCFLNDKEYPPGYSEIRDNQVCECSRAVWHCRVAKPEELKYYEMEAIKSSCSEDKNMETTDCLITCPLTCMNFHKPPVCETVHCKPGCQCKEGFVLDSKSNRCVRPPECPCHHNDRSYKPGETMLQDCNICLCDGGQWRCEERECAGICSMWGENHIKTFDGKMFEFKGECEYTLSQGALNNNVDFTINIQNMPCGSSDVTCFKSATFIIGKEQLQLSKGNPLPESNGDSPFLIRQVGLYTVVHTDIGITLYWDKGTRLYIKAQTKWKEGLHGLCGDFNGNEMDDFRSPLGGPVLVQAYEFANSWKVHSFCPNTQPMTDNCEVNFQRQAWASKKCGVLTSEIFSSCHADVPVEPFLERCISDTCACDVGGDCECTCTAIAAYAQECNIVGKPVTWRSQDLCPIQCRTCDKYAPCMSVCPRDTCETKYLYKELADVCKQEMCVEGCEPPACSADEIFKDDKSFECIPRAECVTQPCKVINGVSYHEGERISDPEVVKPCQSCHCINGEVDCIGTSCELPENVTSTMTTTTEKAKGTTPSICTGEPYWTSWINSYTPTYNNGGDYEVIADLVQGPHQLCPKEYITAIECRTVGSHESLYEAGQIVHCSLEPGLVCENDDQKPNPLCRDYEVRLYCSCEKELPSSSVLPTISRIFPTKPTAECTAPGWTVWMKSSEGYADIASLRKEFSFCGESEIVNAECRDAVSKTESTAYNDIACTKTGGLSCYSEDQTQCSHFEVRFYCRCKDSECDAKLGVESGAISNGQITASSSLYPNLEGQGARLNGKQAWSPAIISEGEWIQVEFEEVNEVTGVLTQGSPTFDEWVTHFIIEYSTDGNYWNQIKEGEEEKEFVGNSDATTVARIDFPTPIKAKYVRIVPTDWVSGISLRIELLGCNPLITTPSNILPTPSPSPLPSKCIKTGWTKWMNADSPENNLNFEVNANELGDHELVSHLRYVYSFCDKPTSVQCRPVGANEQIQAEKQSITCDLNGLKCVNSDQAEGKCLDYEISFFCNCGEITTTTTEKYTEVTTPEIRAPCERGTSGYTDWMNVGNPAADPEGDIESLDELRSTYEFCKSEYITDIECRRTSDQVDYRYAKQDGTTCNIETGFRCVHSQQVNELCDDYEVRFHCLCKDVVETTSEGTTVPEHLLDTGGTTVVGTVTGGELCSKWTDWISLSTPTDREDELVKDLLDVCAIPLDIQCRDVRTKRDYSTFTDLILSPNCTIEGIGCDNIKNDYNCPDFEINVLCECPTSSTAVTPSILIGTKPPVCTQGWTEWFDIDDPESGDGDFERITNLRQHYQFCKNEEITDVKCEAVSDTSYKGTNGQANNNVKCNTEFGLECYNSLQPSGKCLDYKISFFCICEEVTSAIREETPPPVIFTMETITPVCNDWTEWFDTDATDDGIEEELFSAVPNFKKLCPIVTKTECVDFDSELPYDRYTGFELDEACTEKGIRCVGRNCRDFKIRAYCECEGKTTLAPVCEEGWTEWLDVDDPHTDEGDFETMTDLRSRFNFCSEDQIAEVECRSVSSHIDYKETGDYAVKCNKYAGVVCYNQMQGGKQACQDYEIRFYCSCGPETTTSEYTIGKKSTPSTTITTPTTTASTTSKCPEGSQWEECAYDCRYMCHSFLKYNQESGSCPKNDEDQIDNCIPGCVIKECTEPNVWRDNYACIPLEECTCVLENGEILRPGEVVNVDECERCHCLHNDLICEKVPHCGVPRIYNVTKSTTTSPKIEMTTTSRYPLIPVITEDCWTEWMNEDTPDGYGDSETFEILRERYEFCSHPVKIECRVANTFETIEDTDEGATCDLETGLICQNSLIKAKGQKCSDYEVRFYCPCKTVTITTPTFKISTPSVRPIGPCVQGFTDWFNEHEPDERGEYEQVDEIRQYGNLFCDNRYLTSIQCRESKSKKVWHETEDRYTICSLHEGFSCKNSDQVYGRKCSDYEVRYLCDCPTSIKPTKSTTEIVRPTTISTTLKPLITETYPPCAYWSRWINDESPESSLDGDFELKTATTLLKEEKFCLEGKITDIECADAKTGKSFEESEDLELICDLSFGFSCLNENQPTGKCRDYKIRYYCNCEMPSTSTTTPVYTISSTLSSTPKIIIVPSEITPTIERCDGEFVPILSEIPDENFKASSSFSTSTGPQNARLDSNTAWSTKDLNQNQFLQIDLGSLRPVYGFVTKGHAEKNEWVKLYNVLYSRDGISYTAVKNVGSDTQRVFIGNYNNHKEVRQILDNPFEARFIRIQPLIWYSHISLRIEVLGCEEIQPTVPTTIPSTSAVKCDEPMGFEDFSLHDDQIIVSSSRDDFHGPSRIRLFTTETENGSGGWMAGSLDTSQFVQIDFTEERTLEGIETQGRYHTDQYVTTYTVEYSKDGKNWYSVYSATGDEIFPGNYDSDTPVTNYFTQPIRARYLRIKPQTWNSWISMRLEIKGCFKPYERIYEFTATTPSVPTVEIVVTPTPTIPRIIPECTDPMGIENGELDDSLISVSSSLNGEESGASRIRLNTPEEEETGGWVAGKADSREYVQFDFLEPVKLTGVITQGRAKHNEWVEKYVVLYSLDGENWNKVYNKDSEVEFDGNYDGNTPVTQYFEELVTARYVRIQPIEWHKWISMRVEILGCYTPRATVPSTTTSTEMPTTKECVIYGDWVNFGKPYKVDGDYEPIGDIIVESNLCTNPIEIECREVITEQDYRKMNQVMKCDLTHGLQCKNEDQKDGKQCYDYKARIGCYICPGRTTLPPPLPPMRVCPGVPESLKANCPLVCPEGEYCDGKTCVHPSKCACYVDGKKYMPGDRIVTTDCKVCNCLMDSTSVCTKKTCPPCDNGYKSKLTSDCKCECEECKTHQILCPTSNECISKEYWCDGVEDCPDDEKNCTTTLSPTRPTCTPIPTCPPGTVLTMKDPENECPTYLCEKIPSTTLPPLPPQKEVCEMNGNFFKTFDGKEYLYDICDHVLIQDKSQQKFNVTIHKECDEYNRCSKFLEIIQDTHFIRIASDLTVEYNYQQYNALQLIRLGKIIQDFSLRIVGNSVIFQSKKYDFEVEWNKQQNVKIKAEEQLLFQINGLCGLFNNNDKDDFEMSNGQRAKTSEEFGNSWAVGPLDKCEPKACLATAKIEAVASCNNLLLPPLSSCNEFVKPEYHISACIATMCECLMESGKSVKECECEAYLPYVEACKQQTSPAIKINEWRTKLGCIPTCPPGLVWKDCGSACERTCDNLQENLDTCEEESCIAGCFCPEGTVRKRNNTCVPVTKCQDCVCDGYGDPHYNTFDRAYYPFQGNCTYVLSRPKAVDGKHKYEVYVTNDECKEEPGTTCTTAIMVLYKDHIVHFRINESVTIDGIQMRPSDFPLMYDGINVTLTGHPGRTVIITIEEIFLEVRYSESNYGFQVRIPSEVYFGETEGLCADCDHDKSNDMKINNGELTDNIEEFGLSWLATPPEGMEEVDSNCLAHPPKPCHNNTESDKCNVIMSHIFQPCHLLVDPETVLKACRFDMCHSVNPEESLCRSLAEYARACTQAGVCIQNWRSSSLCPVNCSIGMYYDQCGSACIKTIKNKEELKDGNKECELDPVEGCFCLGDKILVDEECRDYKELEYCDDKNHTIGDEWKPDKCTLCTCTENEIVECTKTACLPKPICKKDEVLEKLPTNEEECCDSYRCLPAPIIACPEPEIPTCAPGEVANPATDENNCVEYTCLCDVTQCPKMKEPVLTEEGQVVYVDKSNCCPVKMVQCDKSKCRPDPKCRPGEYLETYNNWKCCPEKQCVPPMDQCYYTHKAEITSEKAIVIANGKEALYEAGDSWTDGKCTKCRCEGSIGHYNAYCQEDICPPLEKNIEDNYVVEQVSVETKCCPDIKLVMCLESGEKYKIGDTWPSTDGDKCKIIQCTNSSSGDAVKATVTKSCKEDCPKGYKYEKPSATSDECCGTCKQINCMEEDIAYDIGETWNSTLKKCAVAECIEDDRVGVITQYSSICPPLPRECPPDKISRDENDCCDICTIEIAEELCNVQKMNLEDTVHIFQILHNGEECSNKQPLPDLTECVGKCDSHSLYSAGKGDFESTCLCCTPDEFINKTITLECTDGTKLPFTYKQPESCSCSLCSHEQGHQQPGIKFPTKQYKR